MLKNFERILRGWSMLGRKGLVLGRSRHSELEWYLFSHTGLRVARNVQR